MRIKKILLTIGLFGLVIGLSACAPKEQKNSNQQTSSNRLTKVSVGVMAAPDCAPLYVARDKGYFKDEGLDVKIHLFKDPSKREAAASAGQINASMVDFVSFTSYMKNSKQWKLITQLTGRFGVAVNKNSSIKSVKDLKGKKIANIQRQVTDYYMYRTLKESGVNPKAIKTVNVPQIPQRLEMLKNNQVAAAVLPQTFLTLSQVQGCKILTQSKPNFELTALAAKGKLASDKTTRQHFLKAYDRAVRDLNNHPKVLQDTLTNDFSLPKPVAKLAPKEFPKYNLAKTANVRTMQDVLNFAREQGFFNKKVNPKNYVIPVD